MTLHKSFASTILIVSLTSPGMSMALDVNITADLPSIQVLHNGRKVTIMRNQDQNNRINPTFAKTSRNCPPFCIQPVEVAAGVKTVGELEMLYYLKKIGDGDKSLLVIDSRKADTVAMGSIPGAVNIPARRLDSAITSLPEIREIMQKQFAAVYKSGSWDFSSARTLVLFCNGPWCSQSSVSIKRLLKLGYPADKLVWYRGGMQSWEALGLTTVKSEIAGMGWID